MYRAVSLVLLVVALDVRAADYPRIEPTQGFCDFKPLLGAFTALSIAVKKVSPPKDDSVWSAGFAIRLNDARDIIAGEQEAWLREAQIMVTFKDRREQASRVDPARPLEMAGRLSYPVVLLSEVGTYLVFTHADPKADDLTAASEEMSKQIYRYVSCEAEVKRQQAKAEAAGTPRTP